MQYVPSIHEIEAIRTAQEVGAMIAPRDYFQHANRGVVVHGIDQHNDLGLIRGGGVGDPLLVSYRHADVEGGDPRSGDCVRFHVRAFTRTTIKGEPDALASAVRRAPEDKPINTPPATTKKPAIVPDGAEQLGRIVGISEGRGGEILADTGIRYQFDWRPLNRTTIPSSELVVDLRVVFVARGGIVASIEKAPESPGLLARFASMLGV